MAKSRNPLRFDPTRTATLRRNFISDLNKRFRRLRGEINQLIVTDDAFGLKPKHMGVPGLKLNEKFRFQTDSQKVDSFRKWLKEKTDAGILGTIDGVDPEEPWTSKYITSSYKQATVRSYGEVNKATLMAEGEVFYEGGKQQFLQDAFSSPERLDKIQLLGTRSFEQLKGINATVGQQLNRQFADAIAQGMGPRQLAKQMNDTIGSISKGRAATMARTEIVMAHAEGQLDSFNDLGVEDVGVMAEWNTAGDDKVCPLCVPLEGIILTVKEARGKIPRHPNCRCAWIPANVGEATKGQTWAGDQINSHVRDSIKAESPGLPIKEARAKSRWLGSVSKFTSKSALKPKKVAKAGPQFVSKGAKASLQKQYPMLLDKDFEIPLAKGQWQLTDDGLKKYAKERGWDESFFVLEEFDAAALKTGDVALHAQVDFIEKQLEKQAAEFAYLKNDILTTFKLPADFKPQISPLKPNAFTPQTMQRFFDHMEETIAHPKYVADSSKEFMASLKSVKAADNFWSQRNSMLNARNKMLAHKALKLEEELAAAKELATSKKALGKALGMDDAKLKTVDGYPVEVQAQEYWAQLNDIVGDADPGFILVESAKILITPSQIVTRLKNKKMLDTFIGDLAKWEKAVHSNKTKTGLAKKSLQKTAGLPPPSPAELKAGNYTMSNMVDSLETKLNKPLSQADKNLLGNKYTFTDQWAAAKEMIAANKKMEKLLAKTTLQAGEIKKQMGPYFAQFKTSANKTKFDLDELVVMYGQFLGQPVNAADIAMNPVLKDALFDVMDAGFANKGYKGQQKIILGHFKKWQDDLPPVKGAAPKLPTPAKTPAPDGLPVAAKTPAPKIKTPDESLNYLEFFDVELGFDMDGTAPVPTGPYFKHKLGKYQPQAMVDAYQEIADTAKVIGGKSAPKKFLKKQTDVDLTDIVKPGDEINHAFFKSVVQDPSTDAEAAVGLIKWKGKYYFRKPELSGSPAHVMAKKVAGHSTMKADVLDLDALVASNPKLKETADGWGVLSPLTDKDAAELVKINDDYFEGFAKADAAKPKPAPDGLPVAAKTPTAPDTPSVKLAEVTNPGFELPPNATKVNVDYTGSFKKTKDETKWINGHADELGFNMNSDEIEAGQIFNYTYTKKQYNEIQDLMADIAGWEDAPVGFDFNDALEMYDVAIDDVIAQNGWASDGLDIMEAVEEMKAGKEQVIRVKKIGGQYFYASEEHQTRAAAHKLMGGTHIKADVVNYDVFEDLNENFIDNLINKVASYEPQKHPNPFNTGYEEFNYYVSWPTGKSQSWHAADKNEWLTQNKPMPAHLSNPPGAAPTPIKGTQLAKDFEAQPTPKPTPKPAPEPVPKPAPEPVPAAQKIDVQFYADLKFEQQLSGSTRPKLMSDPTGKKWVVKADLDAGHVRSENLADRLYDAQGLNTPKSYIVDTAEGPVKISEFLEGGKTLEAWKVGKSKAEIQAMYEQIHDGFVMDTLLANHDVAGLTMDNIFVVKGVPHRIDNGGALMYRAQGAKKKGFDGIVDELVSLRDPNINAQTAEVFKGITDEKIWGQILDIVANEETLLAQVTDPKVKKILKQRIAYLESQVPDAVKAAGPTRTQAANYSLNKKAATEIKESRVNGRTMSVDEDMVEDNNMLVWQNELEDGSQQTIAQLKVTPNAEKIIADRLGGNLKSARTSPSASPNDLGTANLVHPDDVYWADILSAGKNINHHLGAGNHSSINLGKVEAAAKHKPALNKLVADGTMTQNKMAKHYLQQIEDMEKVVADSTSKKAPTVTQYELPTKDKPKPKPTAETLDYTVEQKQLNLATSEFKNGYAKEGVGGDRNQFDVLQYEITTDAGDVISYVPPLEKGKGVGRQQGLAMKGQIQIKIAGETSPEKLAKIKTILGDLGVDIKPPTATYEEALYIHKTAKVVKGKGVGNQMPESYEKIWALPDSQEKVDKLKAWVKTNMKINLPKSGQLSAKDLSWYNPKGRASNEFGNGWRVWDRWDIKPDDVAGADDYVLQHTMGGHLGDTPEGKTAPILQKMLQSGGETTSTTERIRKGVSVYGTGQGSADSDIRTGGASYFFTRLRTKQHSKGVRGLFFKKRNIRRQDAVSLTGDEFGALDRRKDYNLNRTWDALKRQGDDRSGGSNEFIFKNSMDLMNELDFIRVHTKAERLDVIKVLKDEGFSILPDGRTAEEIVKIKGEL